MAVQDQKPPTGSTEPISPAIRRRLQQCYDKGMQSAQTGNFDYAIDMLTHSVVGDPGNQIYIQSFLGTLHRKYNNNKKGSTLASIRSAGSKTSMLNSSRKKDWLSLIKSGLEVLKLNPWDISALVHIARACGELGHVDAQLTYLKFAQDADPKSLTVNRECAMVLETIGQFDQAISCWSRVATGAKGGSAEADEANRAIAKLQVDKTMQKGITQGADEDESADEAAARPNVTSMPKPTKRTRAQELEEQIAANPTDHMLYAELADIYAKADKWTEAESMLSRGLEATGGDLRIREQLEEIQLRKARMQSLIADKRASEAKTPEAAEQANRMRADLNRLEIDVFRKRTERYPTNTHWKFELGARLKKAGNYSEAIKLLQEARNDPKHKGVVYLELGECFQQITQHNLAMQSYETAIAEMPEKEHEQRKKALYRAGKLALGLKRVEEAEKHLSALASLDFGYKDVSALLDKIAELRDKGDSAEPES